VIPPPVLFFSCLLAGWGLGTWRPLSIGLSEVPARLAVAVPLFLAVCAIFAWSFGLFRRHDTSISPWGDPTALITTGPYRFSRNPLYVATALTLLAFSLLLDSLWILGLVPVLLLLLDRLVIRHEETRLLLRFGERYAAYSSRVRRWI
jgi:protein-S-isoprenylcysteine O-methyltransferase Ste14